MRVVWSVCLCCALAAWTCGGSPDRAPEQPVADAGMDEGTDDVTQPAWAPDVPALPASARLRDWECPQGWATAPAGAQTPGLTPSSVCRPAPPQDCAAGSMALPGSGCLRQGPACPALDEWPDEAALRARADGFDGRIWYVSPAGDDGGDGTRDRPLATVNEAMGRSVSGQVIALGLGQYDEVVRIRRHLALVGACVEGTTISTRLATEVDPVIDIDRDATLADLTVTGARGGVWLREPARAILRGVAVRDTVLAGVAATGVGAQIVLEDTIVVNTGGRPSDRSLGYGLSVESGAHAEVIRAYFGHNRDVGVVVIGEGTSATLTDVVVSDTQPDLRGLGGGRGLSVNRGARMEVLRVVVVRNHKIGVFVRDAGTRLTGSFLAVLDTQPNLATMGLGQGLSVQAGAHALLSQVLLDGNRDAGLLVLDTGTTVTVEDGFIVGTQPLATDQSRGVGVAAQGSRVELRRVVLDHNHAAGALATLGAQLVLEDVVITNTQPQREDEYFGRGIHASGAATVTLTRGVMDHNFDVGVLAFDPGSSLVLEDVSITNTQAQRSDMTSGRGLDLSNLASAVLTRVLFDGNHSVAVVAFDSGTRAELEDVTIRNTQPRPADRSVGRGLSVQAGARVELTRGLFEFNHEAAIVAVDPGTVAVLAHVTVRDTRATPCSPVELIPTCDGFLGSGVAILEAEVTLEDFLISGSALAGLQIIEVDTFKAARGEVRDNRIGINVQDTDLDLGVAFDAVTSRANEQDRAFEDLPAPSASSALDALTTAP